MTAASSKRQTPDNDAGHGSDTTTAKHQRRSSMKVDAVGQPQHRDSASADDGTADAITLSRMTRAQQAIVKPAGGQCGSFPLCLLSSRSSLQKAVFVAQLKVCAA